VRTREAALALQGGAPPNYLGAAGPPTAGPAAHTLLATMTTAGFSRAAAVGVGKGNLSAQEGARVAELGVAAAQNCAQAALAGVRFGVGRNYTPGRDADSQVFDSLWRDLAAQALRRGFTATRLGVARGGRANTAALGLAVDTPADASANAFGTLAGLGQSHAADDTAFGPFGTTESAGHTASLSNHTEAGLGSISAVSHPAATQKQLDLQQEQTGDMCGPQLDFAPTTATETGAQPVVLTTLATTPTAAVTGPLLEL
jgi:hypothetical protein